MCSRDCLLGRRGSTCAQTTVWDQDWLIRDDDDSDYTGHNGRQCTQ